MTTRRKAYRNRALLALFLAGGVAWTLRSCEGCGGDTAGDGAKQTPTALKAVTPVDTALRRRVETFLASRIEGRRLAVALYDLTADSLLVSFRADSLMPTASCQKLLTGVAAMHRLGTGHHFATRLYLTGRQEGDTLRGDVVVRAGFDPLLQESDLQPLFARIRRRGIRALTGRVVVDLRGIEYPAPETHWKPWDLVRGKFGFLYRGEERVLTGVLRQARSCGLRLEKDRVVRGRCPVTARLVGTVSRPMEESLLRMMRNSSNVNAESMLYPIGYSFRGEGADYRAAGVEYLRRFVREELHRKDGCHRLHDGCGLCPENSMTPSLLVDLLRYAYHRPALYALLLRTLPTAGVDGTLRREMVHSPARGNVRAKTGTLTHPYGISTLSGYLTGKNGHRYAFSIMCTETPVADARVLQNRLCTEFVK